MELTEILGSAVHKGASDIFFIVGQPVSFKIKGTIVKQDDQFLMKEKIQELVNEMYRLADNRSGEKRETGDDDFALSVPGIGRFRVNIYMQRGAWSAVLRVVAFELPNIETMHIPDSVVNLSRQQKGLVLVTGTAGSGKSTTISYIIDAINNHRNCHILTLEDPIEFLHKHKKSIVSQREVGLDTPNYNQALKAAMRESPDVILIGEMRDLETIEIAMTAAETGHLVLSTLHTVGSANTVDRIIDVFPPNQQQQIRFQLSMVLQAIVSQQLLPTKAGGLVPAFELLKANSAIRTMIRDGKVHQLESTVYSSAKEGMKTMDASIQDWFKQGIIDENTAISYAMNPDTMRRNISRT